MSFPRPIEHSKNYLVTIQVFGDRIIENEFTELNYLATSVDIDYSSGASFVNHKGKSFASAFATQPSVSVRINCYMTNLDFGVLTSSIITEQQQVLLSVGRFKDSIDEEETFFSRKSGLMFEAIGYLQSASISARAGDFVLVNFSLAADDINKIRTDDIPEFNP